MRINKLFSNYGICSRKEVNKLIEDKRIKVNGNLAVLGQWVEEDDIILLDDEQIQKRDSIYIAFYKPVGITTTSEKNVKDNIIDYLNFNQYIFPIGRLDKDSEGLILLTNDGDFANSLINSDNNHEKEYVVQLDRNFDDDFIYRMSEGVTIKEKESTKVKRITDETGICLKNGKEEIINLKEVKEIKENNKNFVTTRKCKVKRINEDMFSITLTQGLNRQIRKMSGALGYKVTKLKRIRIMNIELGDLKSGEYRELSINEISQLKKNLDYK